MQGLALKRQFLSYAAPLLMAAAGGTACAPATQGAVRTAPSSPAVTVVDIPAVEAAPQAPLSLPGPSKAPHVTEDSFDKDVFRSRGFVLLSFTEDGKRDCETFNPHLDAVAAARDDIRVMQVDINENNAIRAGYDIRKGEAPAVVLFHNGVPVQTHKGFIGRDALSDWTDAGIKAAKERPQPSLKEISDVIMKGPAVATDANAEEAVFGHKGLQLVNICVEGVPDCDKVQTPQLAMRLAGKADVVYMPLAASPETAKRIGMVAADGDDVVVPGLFLFKDGEVRGRIVPEDSWWKTTRVIEKAIAQETASAAPRVTTPQRSIGR